jgi:drug/metabolite transporter (DMT)-like permease
MNQLRLERAIVVIALIGGIIALFGTYWDDAWHTDLGRDEFASPPHLVLYGGVALVGLAVAIWAGQTALTRRTFRALLTEPALLLAGIGVLATFLSAPICALESTTHGRRSGAVRSVRCLALEIETTIWSYEFSDSNGFCPSLRRSPYSRHGI